jgi:hypothetical protein
MTWQEMYAQTSAARDRMASDFALANRVQIVVIACDPSTGDVACSSGGLGSKEDLIAFLRVAAEAANIGATEVESVAQVCAAEESRKN